MCHFWGRHPDEYDHMQRADGGANITMKHTGINYGYDRPKELSSQIMGMSEAEKVETARAQLAMYQAQDSEAKFRERLLADLASIEAKLEQFRADVMTRLGRIEKKIEELILRAGLR